MSAYLVAALAGLILGRFLSAAVEAAPAGAPVHSAVGTRPGCGCRSGRWGHLPIVWWVARRGRCPRCEALPGIVHPLIEVVTAGAFAGTVHFVGPTWTLPAYLWFAVVTVVLGFIDFGHHLIPNRILVPGTIVAVVLLAAGAAREDRLGDLPESLMTGLGYFVALGAAAFLTRGAIGMGDVKLAFLLGVFAGYGGWEVAVPAAAGAFLLAGLAAVILIALRRLTRNDHIPFGPFMVAAAWIAIARDLGAG
ncbi:MAG: A24 family peptidase [bacterium]|nr:A24 family peptidase [bacterium]MDE0288384.1 A24 family peptidase [bacterium]MDE0438712.1 A24 family peptidase [bacterium]